MFEVFLGLVLCVLAVIALTEACRGMAGFFYSAPDDRAAFIVTSSGHDEKIEYTVRCLTFRAREMRLKSFPAIIVLDNGMDPQTKEICRILSRENEWIRVCGKNELAGLLCREE